MRTKVQTTILRAKVNELETKTDRIESALLEFIAVHKQIIPVLAGFTVPTNLFPLAAKRKVLLVSMGGDYLEPLNPEVLTSY